MSEVLIKLPCFVNTQHMWSLLNSNNGAKKFEKCESTSLDWQSNRCGPQQWHIYRKPPTSNNKSTEPIAGGAEPLSCSKNVPLWFDGHLINESCLKNHSPCIQSQDQSRTWCFWFHDAMEHGKATVVVWGIPSVCVRMCVQNCTCMYSCQWISIYLCVCVCCLLVYIE